MAAGQRLATTAQGRYPFGEIVLTGFAFPGSEPVLVVVVVVVVVAKYFFYVRIIVHQGQVSLASFKFPFEKCARVCVRRRRGLADRRIQPASQSLSQIKQPTGRTRRLFLTLHLIRMVRAVAVRPKTVATVTRSSIDFDQYK